jgi:hypothetical protein
MEVIEMTNTEKKALLKIAQTVLAEISIKAPMTQITLLESGSDAKGVHYVMFSFKGIEYQTRAQQSDENGYYAWNTTIYTEAPAVEIPTLTELENQMMEAIPNDQFYENGVDSVLWVDCFIEYCGIPAKKARGVLSSLCKKGLIQVDLEKGDADHANNNTLYLTTAGKTYITNLPAEKTIEVELLAFTGMVIGTFTAKLVEDNPHHEVWEVVTKKGVALGFDTETLVQTNANNPKFANKVRIKK